MSYAPPISAQEYAAQNATSQEDLSHLVKTVDRFYLDAMSNTYAPQAQPLIEYILDKLTRIQSTKVKHENTTFGRPKPSTSVAFTRGVTNMASLSANNHSNNSHQNCLPSSSDTIDDAMQQALRKISRKIDHIDNRTKTLQEHTNGQLNREDEKKEARQQHQKIDSKVRVSGATGSIHNQQSNPKFLQEQLSAYDTKVRELESVLDTNADDVRDKLFPILQQREEFRQHMQQLEQSVEMQELENEELRKKLAKASSQIYVQKDDNYGNSKDDHKKKGNTTTTTTNNNTNILENELGIRKEELSRRKRELDLATATQSELIDLVNELYTDQDSVMEELDELTDSYKRLQSHLSELGLDKLELQGIVNSVRDKEASLLAKLALERSKRRELEQQAALYTGSDNHPEQELAKQKIQLLRDTLLTTEQSFTELQGQYATEQAKVAELESICAMEQAKIGKNTFKHAMAKWIGSWYRDKYRFVLQQRSGVVGSSNIGVEVQLREDLDAMQCKLSEKEKELLSAQSKYALYPDLLQKYLALREEYRKHAGDAGAQEAMLDIESEKRSKLEAEVRALKARLALLSAEPKLEFLGDGMGDGLLKDGCMGDYLGVRTLKGINNYLQSRGDTSVAFADHIDQVGASNTPAKKVQVVSERTVYIFNTLTSVEPLLVLNIGSLSRLSMSRLAGSLMVIHHTLRHDQVIQNNRRLEIAYVLQTQYQVIQKVPMHVQYADRQYACDDGVHSREIIAVSSNNIRYSDSRIL